LHPRPVTRCGRTAFGSHDSPPYLQAPEIKKSPEVLEVMVKVYFFDSCNFFPKWVISPLKTLICFSDSALAAEKGVPGISFYSLAK
jgi:hypothetical protein